MSLGKNEVIELLVLHDLATYKRQHELTNEFDPDGSQRRQFVKDQYIFSKLGEDVIRRAHITHHRWCLSRKRAARDTNIDGLQKKLKEDLRQLGASLGEEADEQSLDRDVAALVSSHDFEDDGAHGADLPEDPYNSEDVGAKAEDSEDGLIGEVDITHREASERVPYHGCHSAYDLNEKDDEEVCSASDEDVEIKQELNEVILSMTLH